MKKIFNKICIVLLLITGWSCKGDFLERPPYGMVTEDLFFTKEANFEALLPAIYARSKDLAGYQSRNVFFFEATDDGGGYGAGGGEIQNFSMRADNQDINEMYNARIAAVGDCSYALAKMKAFNFTNKELQKRYERRRR